MGECARCGSGGPLATCGPPSALEPCCLADDFVMGPGGRVATAACVARSRALQAGGRLVGRARGSNFGNTMAEAAEW